MADIQTNAKLVCCLPLGPLIQLFKLWKLVFLETAGKLKINVTAK